MLLTLVGLIVIGSAAQRISGLGFALMLAPFLAVLLGPHQGVMLINLFGFISPALIMLQVWHRIDWKRFYELAIPAIPASILGVGATAILQPGVMGIVIGAVVMVGLLIAMFFRSQGKPYDSNFFRYSIGAATGFSNAVAGVGGPPLTAYALISHWSQRTFAATIQPLFLVVGVIGFFGKLIATPEQMPQMPVWAWVACMIAILVGMWLGTVLEPRIKEVHVRNFVIVIALIGAVVAMVQGILIVSGAIT